METKNDYQHHQHVPPVRPSGLRLRVIAVGLAVPALASTKAEDADAELIRLCDRLTQLRTQELAILAILSRSRL